MEYEIKDVCGVVTVNPKDQKPEDKIIRFVTSDYETITCIPDGGSVTVTSRDGSSRVSKCKYLDAYHFMIFGQAYHICQFGEWLENTGSKITPNGGTL